MRSTITIGWLGALLSLPACSATMISSSQHINFWMRNVNPITKLQAALSVHQQQVFNKAIDRNSKEEFPSLYFPQPLDHFNNSVNASFGQRYWVNSRHYSVGGPVIVVDGGETSGEDRLPFLDTGIIDILAKATRGLGIVLEHRYYGDSIPVKNFSTDALRWLDNAQSLEDSAQFIAKFQWNGTDLSAPKTKWIYYGGSYAGARAAHMRVLYPDLVHGAIASSAVTHAAIDYWEYMEAIRTTANQTCTALLTVVVEHVDDLLSIPVLNGRLKSMFSLSGLDDQDFASVIQNPLGSVQAQNWDPAVGSDEWSRFCGALGAGNVNSRFDVIRKHALLKNYAKWVREEVVKDCAGQAQDCFSTGDATKYQDTSLSQSWRAWVWQVCNEWGYFIGAPPDLAYPRIVSRRLTLEYTSRICRQAFPDGEHVRVPDWPNVTVVNALGDFTLAKDRLAFIDGDEDPWRPATPHSWHAPDRRDTILRPFKMIHTGVHHHDQNGLRNHTLEPERIQNIHAEEIEFVKAWLDL